MSSLIPRDLSPATNPPMPVDDDKLLVFLQQQLKEYGGNVAVDDDLWVLFAVKTTDNRANSMTKMLLRNADFEYHVGESEGDWMLYYTATAHRAQAVFWLDNLNRILSGQFLSPTPALQAMLKDVLASPSAHRVARRMVEMHGRGEISAGVIRDPQLVRGLLDRLHAQEPLYFSAFQILLEHLLVDMLVLYRQLVDEDLRLGNEIMAGAISQDQGQQTRQNAASHIRKQLLRFKIINPLDQQKHTATSNPYVNFTETRLDGEDVLIRVDGLDRKIARQDFVTTIRQIRRTLYHGEKMEDVSTRSPWVTESTAQPLRFIKQQMEGRREVTPLDWLYMLERAVDPNGQVI